MSDRASTEKGFNVMLQQYRKENLPVDLNNSDDLSTDERELCGSMNNFYCGLHLLVGMADVAETALKKFEETYLESKDKEQQAKLLPWEEMKKWCFFTMENLFKTKKDYKQDIKV
ncbi:hypothetical protein KUTeg_018643 [Tegillarca granosa]|uniref:Uncharacterized protein n=1 Tax=Tegillarca granosa TaxID=220873 RepID=A0ABQ9EJZ6_TEGGR|nr:hypothetical protein KUTeg_018643 [Tegillarca granosa]